MPFAKKTILLYTFWKTTSFQSSAQEPGPSHRYHPVSPTRHASYIEQHLAHSRKSYKPNVRASMFMDTHSPCRRSLKVKATVNTFAKETVSKEKMKTPALLLGQPTRPGMMLETSRLRQPGSGMVAEGGCEYHDSFLRTDG